MQAKRASNMIFAPNKNLLIPGETLVTELPYESIESVWNGSNVWFNRQNHDPAAIMFDFDEPLHWAPYIDEAEQAANVALRVSRERATVNRLTRLATKSRLSLGGGTDAAQVVSALALRGRTVSKNSTPRSQLGGDPSGGGGGALTEPRNCTIVPLDVDVVVPPAIKPALVAKMTEQIIGEMKENIRLVRAKAGMDSMFEERSELGLRLDIWLDLQEERLQYEPHLCPPELREVCHVRYSGQFVPPAAEVESGRESWIDFAERYKSFLASMEDFPVRKARRFRAYPVHFSTADLDQVRTYVSELPHYKRLLEWPDEGIVYTVHCKMFSLIGGMLSVWLVVGAQVPYDQEREV